MNITESIVAALESLRMNRLRSMLTLIGMVVGVAAVVTVVSVGEAGKVSLASEYDKYPASVFFLIPVSDNKNSEQLKQASLTQRDVEAIGKIPGITAVSGTLTTIMDSDMGKETLRFNLTVANADLVKTENISMLAGRFFTKTEERGRQRVVVIDEALAEKRFGSPEAAVHGKLLLRGKMYTVTGVYQAESNLFSDFVEKRYGIYVPSQAVPVSGDDNSMPYTYIQAKAEPGKGGELQAVMDRVRQATAARHNLHAGDYIAQSSEETQQIVKRVFGVLQIIVGSIAGVSLLVGGVGVMNIMLVTVTERTREIGIRKAIGATPGAIMGQFLIEAVVLCGIGGTIGMVVGIAGAYIFSLCTKWPFIISWWTVAAAFGFSAAIGMFFGLYPANKASRLLPIESLRYE
ncbi:ABC transporter permease [Paenibacillus athensensis]|uniref:ABC transporter permease n=1 Tax=Paenibacillus athensensis TaxID=1967502 RepID=A0A4Y8PVK8_9BACL|nr:ABC transporter permease [Paenibacillus athensensis]MCD1258781.1 ABC transporter permease [Paenibacillus athensensis]